MPTNTQASSQARSKRSSAAQRPKIVDRMREQVNARVDTQKDRAIESLMGVADTVRRMGEPLQGQSYEPAIEYVNGAAQRIEQVAHYLREREADELVDDLRSVARKQPGAFIGVAFAVGIVCGRFLKSSSRDEDADTGSRRQRRTARRA